MMNSNDIAQALGQSLWTTHSFIPAYRIGESGSWKINPGGQLINDWGYFSGTCLLQMLPSLSRRVIHEDGSEGDDFEVWMSLTPHEIESQELGYLHAYGDMVIMGLGMGWIAANAALNPKVSSVTVIERDPEVIRLIQDAGTFASLPEEAQRKIRIVNADAMQWRPEPEHSIDFLYADIWLHLAEPETLQQVRQMQANIQATQVYYWGQEIAIYAAMMQLSNDKQAIDATLVDKAISDILALPLLVPQQCDYAQLIQQVVDNRTQRGLPIAINTGL